MVGENFLIEARIGHVGPEDERSVVVAQRVVVEGKGSGVEEGEEGEVEEEAECHEWGERWRVLGREG